MAEWTYQHCAGCDVRWHGSERPCWCCGATGEAVPPIVQLSGYMRWDPSKEVVG